MALDKSVEPGDECGGSFRGGEVGQQGREDELSASAAERMAELRASVLQAVLDGAVVEAERLGDLADFEREEVVEFHAASERIG